MDVQKCRVDLSSFGYTLSEVDYSWTSETAVSIAELAINDYTLMEHSQGSTNITTKLGLRSVLTFQFDLSRTWIYKFRINTRYLQYPWLTKSKRTRQKVLIVTKGVS